MASHCRPKAPSEAPCTLARQMAMGDESHKCTNLPPLIPTTCMAPLWSVVGAHMDDAPGQMDMGCAEHGEGYKRTFHLQSAVPETSKAVRLQLRLCFSETDIVDFAAPVAVPPDSQSHAACSQADVQRYQSLAASGHVTMTTDAATHQHKSVSLQLATVHLDASAASCVCTLAPLYTAAHVLTLLCFQADRGMYQELMSHAYIYGYKARLGTRCRDDFGQIRTLDLHSNVAGAVMTP